MWYPVVNSRMASLMVYPPEPRIPNSMVRKRPDMKIFPIGKLGIKQEPGKVRVFAMVDWWTQMILLPIHLYIQGLLQRIPQDATFDQDEGVRRAIEMSKAGFSASFDLSAATDRLPLLLQSIIMNLILPASGQLWGELLTDRDYWLPGYRKSVRYSTGQPMGALSSWVMLALTHHFIVQMAAHRAGWVRWFPQYMVLGDDVVIFDKNVADQYLILMDDLGLTINMSKSLLSYSGSFEFAKRFIFKSEAIPVVSFKEIDASMVSLDALLMLLNRFAGDKWRLSALFKILGFGYNTLARLSAKIAKLSLRAKLLLVWIAKPNNSRWSFPNWVSWLSMKSISGSYPNLLVYQSVLDSLKAAIAKVEPSGLDESWAPTSGYADGKGVSDYGSHTKTFGEGWKADEVAIAFNGILAKVSFNHSISLRENSHWFKKHYPLISVDEDFNNIEQLMDFYTEWQEKLDSVSAVEEDLAVRKEQLGLKLTAGKWLRLFARFRR